MGSCIIAPPASGRGGICGKAELSPELKSNIMYGLIVVTAPNGLGVVPYGDGVVPYGDGVVPYGDGVVPYGDGVPYGLGGIMPYGAGAGPGPRPNIPKAPNIGIPVVVTPGGSVGANGPNGLFGASPGMRAAKGLGK